MITSKEAKAAGELVKALRKNREAQAAMATRVTDLAFSIDPGLEDESMNLIVEEARILKALGGDPC